MTENLAKPVSYEGGCHCGAVRFRVMVEKHEAIECNCSICTKKGFLHLIVPAENFTLLNGEDALTTYQFNTGTAKLETGFLQTILVKMQKLSQKPGFLMCGIHSFYRPRSHPNGFSVNLRCLDEDLLKQFQIIPFDGKNWEKNIDKIAD